MHLKKNPEEQNLSLCADLEKPQEAYYSILMSKIWIHHKMLWWEQLPVTLFISVCTHVEWRKIDFRIL